MCAFASMKTTKSIATGGGMTEQQRNNWLTDMALSFETRNPRDMTIRFGNGASSKKWTSQLALGPTWHRVRRPSSGPMSKAAQRLGRAGGAYNPGAFPLERQATQLQGCTHGTPQHDLKLEHLTPAAGAPRGKPSRAQMGMNLAKSEYEALAQHALHAAHAPKAKARSRRLLERAKHARQMTEAQALVTMARARQRTDLGMALTLLHKFAHSQKVQLAGCAAILALAREEQTGRHPALEEALEHHALACTSAMVRAIARHPDSARVAEQACAALSELVPCHQAAADAVAEVPETVTRDLLWSGASLTALRRAMRGSHSDPAFAVRQHSSPCRAEGAASAVTAGAAAPYAFLQRSGCCCDAICAAMEAHPLHAGLQRRGAAALAMVANTSARAAQYLRNAGAAVLLRRALHAFPIDAAVCANARRALKLLGVVEVEDEEEDALHVDEDFTLFEQLARGLPDTSGHHCKGDTLVSLDVHRHNRDAELELELDVTRRLSLSPEPAPSELSPTRREHPQLTVTRRQ